MTHLTWTTTAVLATALMWGTPTASASLGQHPDTTAPTFITHDVGEFHHQLSEVQSEHGVRAAGPWPILEDRNPDLPELLDTPLGPLPDSNTTAAVAPVSPEIVPPAAPPRILLPEPGTFLLLASGLTVAARAWRRRG